MCLKIRRTCFLESYPVLSVQIVFGFSYPQLKKSKKPSLKSWLFGKSFYGDNESSYVL